MELAVLQRGELDAKAELLPNGHGAGA